MPSLKKTPDQKARDTYYTAVNKRVEKIQRQASIKEQYGVFTRGMQEDLFRKVLVEQLTPALEKQKTEIKNEVITEIKREIISVKQGISYIQDQQEIQKERLDAIEKKLDTVSQQVDWLYGHYQKQDQEHTLLSSSVSKHEDRIEKLEKRLGVAN